jgi:hypothetical protein
MRPLLDLKFTPLVGPKRPAPATVMLTLSLDVLRLSSSQERSLM